MADLSPGVQTVTGPDQKSGILHLLMSSESQAFDQCLQASRREDVVVLMDRGVMKLMSLEEGTVSDFPCTVLVLRSDCEARIGPLQKPLEPVRSIDEGELVALMVSLPHCLSWR